MFQKKFLHLLLVVTFSVTASIQSSPKTVPQAGIITNYTLFQVCERFVRYARGYHDRIGEILVEIQNNNLEEFKKKFKKGDLVDHPEIIEEIILNNRVSFVRFLDESENVDIKRVLDNYYETVNNVQKKIIMHELIERHGIHAIEMKDLLNELGFDINKANAHGETIAHLAAIKKDIPLLQDLVSKGDIDINGADVHGGTLLHIAVKTDNPELVKKLNSWGASVNVQDNQGNTPAHTAILEAKSVKVFNELLEGGADEFLSNNDLKTYEDLLYKKYKKHCVKRFRVGSVTREEFIVGSCLCKQYSSFEAQFRKNLAKRQAKHHEKNWQVKKEAKDEVLNKIERDIIEQKAKLEQIRKEKDAELFEEEAVKDMLFNNLTELGQDNN